MQILSQQKKRVWGGGGGGNMYDYTHKKTTDADGFFSFI